MSGIRVDVMGLCKRFGRKQVLRGVDLSITPSRITALVGPNSSGKTTFLKCLLGMVRPDPGSAILMDGSPVNGGPEYRRRIGYMPQAAKFPELLTGRELLRFLMDLRGSPADRDESLIEAFRLESQLDKPVRTLSGGTRQKLNAVAAFLFRPSLLILDEPTAGLDPAAASVLKDRVLQAPGQGTTVLLTSHLMAEVEELAQDILFLAEGRIAFAGTVESLIRESGETKLERAIARFLSRAAA